MFDRAHLTLDKQITTFDDSSDSKNSRSDWPDYPSEKRPPERRLRIGMPNFLLPTGQSDCFQQTHHCLETLTVFIKYGDCETHHRPP